MARVRSNIAQQIAAHARSIALFILTAIIGATISYYVNLLIEWTQNRENNSLKGNWISASCDRTLPTGKYVIYDKVFIDFTYINGITIRNKIHSAYDYEGVGKIYENRFFYGTWKSLKPGANTRGAFSFSISPQGDFLAGTFTGDDEIGPYTQCWIMARNRQALIKGFETFKSQLSAIRTLQLDPPANLGN